MKQMLKIELERAFRGAGFKVALLIGCAISLMQFINMGVRNAMNPLEFYTYNGLDMPYNLVYTWMGGTFNLYYTVYVRILPILVTIPYAVTYYTDKRSGIIKNYYIRTKKINYLTAKIIAVFLTGGVVSILPLFINFVSTSAIVPTLVWPSSSTGVIANAMWSSIYYSNIYLYYLLYFILEFICGGLLATVSLMISFWVNNAFIVLLFPFVLCEFMNVVASWFSNIAAIRGLQPVRLFCMHQLAINYWQSYVIFISVIIILDLVVYMWRGIKNDTI